MVDDDDDDEDDCQFVWHSKHRLKRESHRPTRGRIIVDQNIKIEVEKKSDGKKRMVEYFF